MLQTWAVIAQKGGAGKTTISLHVAIALTQMGFKVELVDVDPQSSAYKWAQQRKARPPAAVPIVAAQIFGVLEQASHSAIDIALVDTSPRADRDSLTVAAAADFIIIPCRPSPLDTPAVEDTIDLLRRAGHLDKAVIVLNAVAANTDEGKMAAQYLRTLGPPVCPHWLGERADFRRSLLLGQGVTEAKKSSPAVKELVAVTKWLVKTADTTLTAKVPKDGKTSKPVRKAI